MGKTKKTQEFAASLVTWPDMLKFFIWSSVGEVNPGSILVNARNPETALSLYLCFVVLSTLVLMNLLISLMSNTFATDTAHGRQIWWFEFAALVLRYEARLSDKRKEKYRCGRFFPQGTSERGKGKHDVVWYDIKYKNARESQGVRKWRKNIIKNEATKDFINDKFSELVTELQEKFHHIEDLLKKNKRNIEDLLKASANPAVKEEEDPQPRKEEALQPPKEEERPRQEDRQEALPPLKEEERRQKRQQRRREQT
jgi:hypothetical protein